MSRNRNVWPREQVAHLWAHASQDQARDPSGNMYFYGPTLYSYGRHYAIGYRVSHRLFVMNADTCSHTTSKMRWIARLAVPSFAEKLWIGDLSENDFSGQRWRAALLRKALVQAGRLYSRAGAVSRISAKRDGMMADARLRLDAARALASHFIDDKELSADDRKAARAALRTLDKANAIAWPARDAERKAQNAGEVAACNALAFLLVRDELREDFRNLIAGALEHVEHARTWNRLTWERRDGELRAALGKIERARELAKLHKFRMPKVPNVDALIVDIAPQVAAEALADALDDMRGSLENAENSARNAHGNYFCNGNVTSQAQRVRDAARVAANYGGNPSAWMIERAAHLSAKAARRQSLFVSPADVGRIECAFRDGKEYAEGGAYRSAAQEYGRALRILDASRRGLAEVPTHPGARRLAEFEPQRAEAVAFLETVRERIAEEDAESIAAWRRGERRSFDTARDLPPLLRIVGDEIQTSHGAIVPRSAAPRLWGLAERARAGEDVSRFHGLHVGPFTLHELKPDGSAVVGCHSLEYAEMRACAAALGLDMLP